MALEMAGKAEEVEAQASSEQHYQQLHARLREAAVLASQKAQVPDLGRDHYGLDKTDQAKKVWIRKK